MRSAAKEMLQVFSEVPWLSRGGIEDELDGASRVATWSVASKMCKQRLHENVQTESRNLLTSYLFANARERYRQWNRLANAHRARIDKVIEHAIVANPYKFKIDDKVFIYIRIDLLMTLMELEYADVIAPRYFAERVKWYLAGRFPCGWNGAFPAGQLFVF